MNRFRYMLALVRSEAGIPIQGFCDVRQPASRRTPGRAPIAMVQASSIKKLSIILLALCAVRVEGAVNAPLTVQEAIYPGGVAGVARTNEPFCMGVPLPDSAAVKSADWHRRGSSRGSELAVHRSELPRTIGPATNPWTFPLGLPGWAAQGSLLALGLDLLASGEGKLPDRRRLLCPSWDRLRSVRAGAWTSCPRRVRA